MLAKCADKAQTWGVSKHRQLGRNLNLTDVGPDISIQK